MFNIYQNSLELFYTRITTRQSQQ